MTAPAPVDPGVSSPAPTPVAAPPVQPAQPETTPEAAAPVAEPAKGPIPFERHESILKNAREKTRAEITQQFQQQYGPHVELGQRIEADPVGTVVGLIQGLASHPDHGQAVISALARTLGSRRNQAPSDQEPQADLQTPDGTLVYSAPQLAKREAWLRQQMESSIDQRLQPLQQREQQRLAAERLANEQTAADERMAKVLTPYKQLLPDFEKHKPALREKTTAYLAEGYDAQTALGLAVSSILHSTVTPARVAESQQQLVAQAVAKSTGSTSPPGAAPSAPAQRPTSFDEAYARIKL